MVTVMWLMCGVHRKVPQMRPRHPRRRRGNRREHDDLIAVRSARRSSAKGTKIDNLVQIAHNVEIGEHCLLVAQAAGRGQF